MSTRDLMIGGPEMQNFIAQREREARARMDDAEPKREVVRRFDAGSLASPEKHDSGFLRVDGRISRIGIQQYTRKDGTIRRELRLPEDVFDPAAMRSFHMVPVTNGHPDRLLTPDIAKAHTVGAVGESVRKDGDHVAATMMIHDEAAMKSIRDGRTKLSCGYTAEMEEKPGVWNGQEYDAIQRCIRGNHLALVDVPRAGLSASLRLDGADAMSAELAALETTVVGSSASTSRTENTSMGKLRIDGHEIEMTEANAGLIQTHIDRMSDAAKTKLDGATNGLQTKLDASSKQIEHAKENVSRFIENMDGQALQVACPFCDDITPGKLTKLDGEAEDCGACDGKGVMPAALLGPMPDVSALKGDKLVNEQKADSAAQAKADQARAKRGEELAKTIRAHVDHAVEHRVEKRAALKIAAERVMGAEEATKLDGKTELEIKRAVAQHANKSMKLDGRDAAYITALFDKAVADVGTPAEQVMAGLRPVPAPLPQIRADGKNNPDAARQRMAERNEKAWQKKEAK